MIYIKIIIKEEIMNLFWKIFFTVFYSIVFLIGFFHVPILLTLDKYFLPGRSFLMLVTTPLIIILFSIPLCTCIYFYFVKDMQGKTKFHKMSLNSTEFEKICNGESVYIFYLYDKKNQEIKQKDIINISKDTNLNEILKVKVIDLKHFQNFYDLANTLPLDKIGFADKSINDAVKYYNTMYPDIEKGKGDITALKIEVIYSYKN